MSAGMSMSVPQNISNIQGMLKGIACRGQPSYNALKSVAHECVSAMPDRPSHLMSRIYNESDLRRGMTITPAPDQSHYLKNVMRLKPGDGVRLFNGRDGEWRGEIATADKKAVTIKIAEQLKTQIAEPDLWLCCAPIKKAHFDFMIEKAAELGISVLQPILTQRTQVREVNVDRARAIAVEAAEQSERLSVPEIRKPVALDKLIASWPHDRALIVCAEHGVATPVKEAFALRRLKGTPAGIITGPEGGFAEDELERLRKIDGAIFARLGPRILRADTAVIAALSCWQALCGDWG
jgi:16S rRNA (uracil1498-N3)-methyltransferase